MQEVVCTHLVRRPAGVAIFRKTPAAAGGGKDKKRKDVSLFQSFFDLSQKKNTRAAVLTTPLPPVATAAVVGFGATYGASS